MSQGMKNGSTTTHLIQKDRQLSGQQLVKAVQSDQKLNNGLARLWHPYFGTRMVFYLSTVLRKVNHQQRLLHCITGSIERRNQEKTASHAKENSAVPLRQCTVPQVAENDG